MVSKKNKKAWWRIIEAVIGVLIILSALIFFVSQQTKNMGKEERAKEVLRIILEEIEKNYTIRNYIINNQQNDLIKIDEFISYKINSFAPNYNYSFCIIPPHLTCSYFYPFDIKNVKKDIFSSSILISYEINGKINSTKFVLYVWQK